MFRTLKQAALIFFIHAALISSAVRAQPITSQGIDTVAANALKAFNVPGIAVGVIKDGKLIHAKGYGVRSLNSMQPVDENTIFGVASNSKVLAAATIGILVDEGKLSWDTKVREIIPEFMLYDPYVTEQFTLRDLLTHRSGLGLGAGDLMFFPDSNNFTVPQIIHNLRYLKPVSSFRSKYDYNNNLYTVAGEVVARVSGMPWTEFVEKRIFKPLGMNKTASLYSRLPDKSNVIDGHCPIDGVVKVIPRNSCSLWPAAAGVNSSITDLSKWVIAMLNKGKYGEGLRDTLLSDAVWYEMTSPQTIQPNRGPGPYNTHFYAYGLGLGLTDVKGYKQLMHTGGLEGMVTQITMIPELQLGIIVLTNQQEGGAFASVTNQIKDSYLGITGTDRVKENLQRRNAAWDQANKAVAEVWKTVDESRKTRKGETDWSSYTGVYNDSWMGDWVVSVKNGKLWLDSKMSPRLTGEMFFYKGNTFVVKWSDRSFDADAFVMFTLDKNGVADGFTMEAISPMTDFSYDFHDMDLKRKK